MFSWKLSYRIQVLTFLCPIIDVPGSVQKLGHLWLSFVLRPAFILVSPVCSLCQVILDRTSLLGGQSCWGGIQVCHLIAHLVFISFPGHWGHCT